VSYSDEEVTLNILTVAVELHLARGQPVSMEFDIGQLYLLCQTQSTKRH
jgi:hypothetical protein